MNKKRIGAILLGALLLVGGIFIFSNNNKSEDIPPIGQPIGGDIGGEYVPDEEFNNFDIDKVLKSTTEIQIKSHSNDQTFVTISDKEDIATLTSLVKDTRNTEIASETHEKIAMAQGEGNSITLSFTLDDGTICSTRVLLNLNIISINDNYGEISSELTNILQEKLKEVPNFKDLNRPIPGF